MAASALFTDLLSLAELKPSQCVARLEELPLTAVYAVFLAAPEGQARQNLHDYLETWRHVKPKTNGNDLKKRGLPAGTTLPANLITLAASLAGWRSENRK